MAGATYLVGFLVQLQIGVGHHCSAGIDAGLAVAGWLGAAQDRSQPQHQLLQAERLGHVVVAARGEAGDPVVDAVPGGQEQHW